MESVRISIVIPCRNGERYLTETLESVRSQERRPVEVILADDASTDGSREIAASYGVKIVGTSQPRGPAAARNLGVAHTTGDAVCLLDADDLLAPTHLANVAALLEAHPELVLAFSRAVLFGAVQWEQESFFPPNNPVDAFFTCVEHSNVILTSGTLIRKSAWEAVGGFDEALVGAEDFEFWTRITRHGPVAVTPTPTVRYRKYRGQLSSKVRQVRTNEFKARSRMIALARFTESPEVVERIEQACLAAWMQRCAYAWHTRDPELAMLYLSFAPMIPGAEQHVPHWRRKYALLPLARTLDKARRLIRR